jgi:hypothetical protein
MDEDDGTPLWKHQVGIAGQVRPVNTEAIAEPVSNAPDQLFGSGVLRANCAHVSGALGWSNSVCHFEDFRTCEWWTR